MEEEAVSITPEEALRMARRVLNASVDGQPRALSIEEARALLTELWDLRAELGRVRAQLRRERDQRLKMAAAHAQAIEHLTAQVVSEEARAVMAERDAAWLREHLD